MTPQQQAAQLRLAADILETGHPWEWLSVDGDWLKAEHNEPEVEIATGHRIRPILATPPDGRPLHNPDNLTAEQVGVGYRLPTLEESGTQPHDFWSGEAWEKAEVFSSLKFEYYACSCRLPLFVPWPEAKPDPYAELKAAHAAGKVIQLRNVKRGRTEWKDIIDPAWNRNDEGDEYRIKPEPTFQLPPPPPGMQWHREDGWQEGDLPQGWRPQTEEEITQKGDQFRHLSHSHWDTEFCNGRTPSKEKRDYLLRTTRPLTFTHAGKQWMWHRPGDPMPCDGEARIEIVCCEGRTTDVSGCEYVSRLSRSNLWDKTLGWRYADEKKTVPLGPDDVMPGSVFRLIKPEGRTPWIACVFAMYQSVELSQSSRTFNVTYEKLLEEWQINRSIPLTGRWNPDAWEPCSKQI